MAEEDALVLYISTSVMAKAEDCETVRAGMGLLVGGKMGKERSRDRWLGMEKTQYHSLQCFSGPIGSIQPVFALPQQRSYRQRHRAGCLLSRRITPYRKYKATCRMCIRSTACQIGMSQMVGGWCQSCGNEHVVSQKFSPHLVRATLTPLDLVARECFKNYKQCCQNLVRG